MKPVGEKRDVVVIAGATATGKTALGEAVAEALGGVVVCADARQVFAELDIGTGKPNAAERAARPHHLFDWRRMGEHVSAGAWAREAARCCEDAFAARRTPVLVGGSGLYLRALIEGLHGEPGHDATVRAELEAMLARDGLEPLRARLEALDPETAARLMANDRQRVLRALEVVIATGSTLSARHAAPRQPVLHADFRIVELTASLESLASRIAARSRQMFDGGLLEETRQIVAAQRGPALTALHAIGYDEALAHLAGTSTLEAAIAATSLRTRQLAKRQRTWFRHQLIADRLDTDVASMPELTRAVMRVLERGTHDV